MTLLANNYVAVFGRQPEFGLAELEALYGAEALTPFGAHFALLETPQQPSPHVGSVIKFAHILAELDTIDWPVIEKFLIDLGVDMEKGLPEGKMTVGVSAYGFNMSSRQLGHTSLLIKKAVKQSGRSIRLVPNTGLEMNSAQIIHNKLTGERGIELCVFRSGRGAIVAKTVWEQPIEAYAKRDQARPMRDARVGMLPPKLAQTILNLATGAVDATEHSPVVLDPFCGTGVVVQEGLLMGYHMIGSDIEQRMIDYTQKNIDWLYSRFGYDGFLRYLAVGDAATHAWSDADNITNVACETFLGRPFSGETSLQDIEKERHTVSAILRQTLRNLSRQLQPGTRLCLAVPAWHTKHKVITLPLLDHLPELGYNLVSFRHTDSSSLIYHRENQVVGRQLLVVIKD